MREQQGIIGKVLGGWQVSSFFTLQSGAPFTVLNGSDPTSALSGISALVGNAIRPNLNTDLELSKMTIDEIRAAGGSSLFRTLCGMPSATCPGERVGNVGRNTLRADGIANLDFGFYEEHAVRQRPEHPVPRRDVQRHEYAELCIPDGSVTSANFLNQWATNGGNRRIWIAVRYVF